MYKLKNFMITKKKHLQVIVHKIAQIMDNNKHKQIIFRITAI